MKMNLTREQIFGMYKHCPVYSKTYDKQGYISEINYTIGGIELFIMDEGITRLTGDLIDNCKLILRPFEDIKEVEGLTFCRIRTPEEKEVSIGYCKAIGKFESYTFEEVAYLISISIDVFGAIEKGWAIKESGIT